MLFGSDPDNPRTVDSFPGETGRMRAGGSERGGEGERGRGGEGERGGNTSNMALGLYSPCMFSSWHRRRGYRSGPTAASSLYTWPLDLMVSCYLDARHLDVREGGREGGRGRDRVSVTELLNVLSS